MLRLTPFLFLATLALLACGCAERDRGRLVVGMELAYPPFEMTDAQGEPAGVSVDLAHALGAHLGRAVTIENIAFDGLIPSLKTGRIDLVISSMTATPERAQSIDFSEPYLSTGLALLVAAKSDVRSVSDLAQPGRTVAVKKGTTGALYAAEHLRAARVLVLDKENTCVLEVAQGKADAFIYDQMSVLQNWRRHPETTRPLLEAFQAESWAIGVRKGNDDLREKVNAFLKDFRARGGFERLGDRWLAEQKKEFQARGIPFVF
jgi:polar amino acid transport system substrate-binding protein